MLVAAAAKDALHVFPPRQREQRARLLLAVDVLAEVPAGMTDIAIDREAAPRYYSEDVATQLARGVAVGIHVRSQLAFAQGLEAASARTHAAVRRRLDRHEQALRVQLVALRAAVVAADPAAAIAVLAAVTRDAHQELPDLLQEAARASRRPGRKSVGLGLEASTLARRHAMTAAACVLLHRRLVLDRLVRGTKLAAEQAKLLRRDVVRAELARTGLSELDVGHRLSFVGRTRGVEWIERPRKPFTLVTFEGSTLDLHVPRRSLERRGVTPGTVLWATGTVKAGEHPYLESEFEGPGTHRRRYFEDYLATLARPAYDLYPGTMLLEWELPSLQTPRAANDLLGRLI